MDEPVMMVPAHARHACLATVRWVRLAMFHAVLLIAMPDHACAQSVERPTDIAPQIAAAYLNKFTSFVEWPADAFAAADSQIVIGVMGADAFARQMSTDFAGRSSNGHRFVVRRLQPSDPIASLHILFLGRMTKKQMVDILALAAGRPVLTITETEEGFSSGSMVNFDIIDERLRFAVSLKPLGPSHMKISALMLAAAYKVLKDAP